MQFGFVINKYWLILRKKSFFGLFLEVFYRKKIVNTIALQLFFFFFFFFLWGGKMAKSFKDVAYILNYLICFCSLIFFPWKIIEMCGEEHSHFPYRFFNPRIPSTIFSFLCRQKWFKSGMKNRKRSSWWKWRMKRRRRRRIRGYSECERFNFGSIICLVVKSVDKRYISIWNSG